MPWPLAHRLVSKEWSEDTSSHWITGDGACEAPRLALPVGGEHCEQSALRYVAPLARDHAEPSRAHAQVVPFAVTTGSTRTSTAKAARSVPRAGGTLGTFVTAQRSFRPMMGSRLMPMPSAIVIHGRWFVDLDVFHKGLARARDADGWTHIDRCGEPAYARRFAQVEPFYNGQAGVERDDGGLEVIDSTGAVLVELRPARSASQMLELS